MDLVGSDHSCLELLACWRTKQSAGHDVTESKDILKHVSPENHHQWLRKSMQAAPPQTCKVSADSAAAGWTMKLLGTCLKVWWLCPERATIMLKAQNPYNNPLVVIFQ